MKKVFIFFALLTISVTIYSQSKTIIYFDSNKNDLKPSAIHQLDSISNFLLILKGYNITICGYCDNSGNEKSNQLLSEKRAIEVSGYLKKKNINPKFISIKGFSSNDPVASNDNEAGKAKNRRVEITVEIDLPPADVRLPISDPVPSVPEIHDTAPAPTVEKKGSFGSTSTIDDLEIGTTLILKNLNFVAGTATLLDEAKPTLELLVKTLKDNPSLEIEIGGHVCCANDMELSILRAKSVFKYLIKKGIDESRLTYKGYSRNKPIYEDDRAPAEAKANRRVEITVLKK